MLLYGVYLLLLSVGTAVAAEWWLRWQEDRSGVYPLSDGAIQDDSWYGHRLAGDYAGAIDSHGRLPVPVARFTTDVNGWRRNGRESTATEGSVVVAGDSQVFGYWLPDEETVTSIAESRLSVRGLRLRVVNAGVPGFGTINEYFAVRRALEIMPVRGVVLVYYTGNDLENNGANHLLGADARGRLRGRTDYEALALRFRGSPPTPFRELVVGDLDQYVSFVREKSWRHRAIWWLEYDLRSLLFRRLLALTANGEAYAPPSAGPADGGSSARFRTVDSRYKELWRFQSAAFEALIDLTRSARVPLRILVLPQFSEIQGAFDRTDLPAGAEDLGSAVCDYFHLQGIECRDLRPQLDNPGEPMFFEPIDQHLTSAGASVVGTAVADEIVASGIR